MKKEKENNRMTNSRIFLDITPLRESPEFRRLWAGNGLSTFGGYMTSFAVILQIYLLTHSSLAVGAAGLCSALPSILFVLIGGTIGDSVDRRKIVLLATSGQTLVSGIFVAQAFYGHGYLWLLYTLLVVQALLTSFNAPARRTFMPRLLPKEQLRAGATLNMVFMRFSGVFGPVVAGLLGALWGLKVCYVVDVLSYGAALYGVARLPAMPPEGTGKKGPTIRAIGEGLRFIFSNKFVAGAFLADLSVTVLGTPTALFPAVNAVHFGGNAQTLGLLMGAPAAGGLIGSLLSGPLKRVTREGRAILVCSLIWAASIVGVGYGNYLWIVLFFLLIAGAADTILVVLNTTIVQVNTPDRYRGRVSAVEYLVGTGGPKLGDFRAGVIGSFFPPEVGIIIGGISAAFGASLVSTLMPTFRRYVTPKMHPNTDA